MRRVLCPDGQIDIFPEDLMAELFAHQPAAEPLPPLPIPANKSVDMDRACKILDTNRTTVRRMLKTGLLTAFQPVEGARQAHRISHTSLVEYCDMLRARYRLPKRKPHTGPRPPDDTILPFPASETIAVEVVMEHLGIGRISTYKLFDSGDLAAYQLIVDSNAPWRIHRPSLVAYCHKLSRKIEAQRHASPAGSQRPSPLAASPR